MNRMSDRSIVFAVLVLSYILIVATRHNEKALSFAEGAATTTLGCLCGLAQQKKD